MNLKRAQTEERSIMRAKRLIQIACALSTLALLAAGCGGKSNRPPATTAAPPPSTGSSTGTRAPVTTAPTPTPEISPDDSSLASLEDPDNISGLTIDELNDRQPLADIRFDFDSAVLSDAARATLEDHASWLKRNPTITLLIEGHCDERGTVEYNLALGERRAGATADYLMSLGIPSGRLKTISYGKEFPLDPGHNEEAWARNRRAHFEITAK
jgi:peptidoglycan-associated lipoprotein